MTKEIWQCWCQEAVAQIKYGTYRHPWIFRWLTALVVIRIAILLNVVITIQGHAMRLG